MELLNLLLFPIYKFTRVLTISKLIEIWRWTLEETLFLKRCFQQTILQIVAVYQATRGHSRNFRFPLIHLSFEGVLIVRETDEIHSFS